MFGAGEQQEILWEYDLHIDRYIYYILKDMTKDTGSTRIHQKLGFQKRKKRKS